MVANVRSSIVEATADKESPIFALTDADVKNNLSVREYEHFSRIRRHANNAAREFGVTTFWAKGDFEGDCSEDGIMTIQFEVKEDGDLVKGRAAYFEFAVQCGLVVSTLKDSDAIELRYPRTRR